MFLKHVHSQIPCLNDHCHDSFKVHLIAKTGGLKTDSYKDSSLLHGFLSSISESDLDLVSLFGAQRRRQAFKLSFKVKKVWSGIFKSKAF